ncbi:MAG: GtrA family protein [Alphaproteobacteria bacterium]|nr:GtrA family protein [Alphaproteobacteria bacterium]
MQNLVTQGLKIFFALRQELRYLLVGGFNTAVGLVLFTVFFLIFKSMMRPSFILYFSSFFSITVSFFTLKYFVFQSQGKFLKEYPRTFLVQTVSLILNGVLLDYVTKMFGFYPLYTQPVLVLFIAISGYFAHKMYSFK